MVMIGGREVTAEMSVQLSKLGRATGARVCLETFPTRVARGAGTGKLEKLPYLAEQAIEHLKGIENLILVGSKSPVSFFAYPDVPSVLPAKNCQQFQLAVPGDDIAGCLQHLLEALKADDAEPILNDKTLPALPQGTLNVGTLAQSLAALIPENAVVVDDSGTATLACYPATQTAASHDWLSLTGGSIGFGLPCAVGAAVACPDRKIVCLEGDGSAMYTIQSLWTMARENLDVTVVIFNNQKYSILELEFMRTGARGGVPGPKAASMLGIGNPNLNFVDLAKGMGVSASRATTAKEFNQQFAEAVAGTGPHLIEAMVPPIDFQS
jgi:acetolactate synthase-1/2/3 large subunit